MMMKKLSGALLQISRVTEPSRVSVFTLPTLFLVERSWTLALTQNIVSIRHSFSTLDRFNHFRSPHGELVRHHLK